MDKFVSTQQLELLPKRLQLAEETYAAKKLRDFIYRISKNKDHNPLKILIVGAGGSYPAALFARHAINFDKPTSTIEVAQPLSAIRILNQHAHISGYDFSKDYDLVIAISYSGQTEDIRAVANICIARNLPFLLLTGENKENLKDIYIENNIFRIVSYFNHNDDTEKENGMISMFSTIAPCAVFDDSSGGIHSIEDNLEALEKGRSFVNSLNIAEIAAMLKSNPIIHVFYDWTTQPAAADIESKFTEAGIAHVILHEKKNFSHGRTTIMYKQNFGLVINLSRFILGINFLTNQSYNIIKDGYDGVLHKFLTDLCMEKGVHYISLGTPALFATQWNMETMAVIPYLITAIGNAMGVDISNPIIPYPKESNYLYNYKGIL